VYCQKLKPGRPEFLAQAPNNNPLTILKKLFPSANSSKHAKASELFTNNFLDFSKAPHHVIKRNAYANETHT
jgi:hypothetical protein